MSAQETALAVQQEPKPQLQVISPEPQSTRLTRLAAFTPVNLTEAIALSKLIAGSDLAPKDYRGKAGNVLIGMQYAAELGIPPLIGLQNISIINGRASLWGDLFLGIIQTSPHYEWHKEWMEGEGEALTAVCQMKRKGQEVHTTKFSVADARKAGLWGKIGPWQTSPKRMLQMRSRGFCGRDKFADVLKGLIIAEEAMDIPADNSDAKKMREAGTLDVNATVTDLVPSAEPNRGHGNEGLRRVADQPDPKPDNVMCSDCGVVNGHEATCKHAAAAAQDAKTSKPTTKAAYMILAVAEKKKKNGEPYIILEVVAPDNSQGKLYVWHRSLYDALAESKGKGLECEVSGETKDGKTFYQLEHITNLGGVPYVDNKPAQQADAPEDF